MVVLAFNPSAGELEVEEAEIKGHQYIVQQTLLLDCLVWYCQLPSNDVEA